MSKHLSQMKAQPILKMVNDIAIYNINSEENKSKREQITTYVIDMIKNVEGKSVEQLGREMLIYTIPILSDISFEGMADVDIQNTLDFADDELMEVTETVVEIIKGVTKHVENTFEIVRNNPDAFKVKKTKKELLLEQWKQEEINRKAKLEKELAEIED